MGISLSGDLSYMSLGELVQIFGSNGSTGILRLMNKYNDNLGEVHFFNGNPVNAICDKKQGKDALYMLFGWTEGEFEFNLTNVNEKDYIKKSRMEIMLEGSRMVDDGVIEKVGPVSFKRGDKSTGNALPVISGPLVDYMYVVDEEDYKDGQEIIKQGKHGNWNWVVLDGIVEIRKETPKGPIPILRVGNGSFVGSIAGLLTKNNVRSASVVADGDVQLGVVDSQRLSMEYARLSREFKNIILSLDKRVKQITNKLVEIELMIKTDDSNITKGKEIIIKQGSNKKDAFIVTDGRAFVIRKTDSGYVLLATLEEGDFFGSIPFLNLGQEPDSAHVIAPKGQLVHDVVDCDLLQSEHDKLSATFKNMIENTAIFLSATTTLSCTPKKKKKKGKK